MAVIGKNLKQIRLARNLTQDEVAKACGVPQNQWSKWESGKAQPKIKTILRIAVALDLPVTALIVGINREFDLACQKRDQEFPLNDTASARVLELESQNTTLRASLAKVENVASQLIQIAKVGVEGDRIATARPGGGGRHRKAG